MVEIDDNNLDQDSIKKKSIQFELLLFFKIIFPTGWVLYGDALVRVLTDEVPVVE
jgi:hypothetical protein